jgi:nucleotide-binding universal stress UspA family protein
VLPKKIVVGTDGSDTACIAVRSAIELAKALGADLHLVTAYDPVSAVPLAAAEPTVVAALLTDVEWMKANTRQANDILDRAAQWAKDVGITAECHTANGSAPDAIISTAENVGADLIVVGDKGMAGLKRFLTGSVPNAVAHKAPCSVWIVDSCEQARDLN